MWLLNCVKVLTLWTVSRLSFSGKALAWAAALLFIHSMKIGVYTYLLQQNYPIFEVAGNEKDARDFDMFTSPSSTNASSTFASSANEGKDSHDGLLFERSLTFQRNVFELIRSLLQDHFWA